MPITSAQDEVLHATPVDRSLHSINAFHLSHCKGQHRWQAAAQPALRDDFDMEPSIARSDTFDVSLYELTLDLTDYTGMTIQGDARIEMQVIEADGSELWFDLVDGLTVDSVQVDGIGLEFLHQNDRLDLSAPEGGWQNGASHVVQIWYGGQPGADPYWGGFYFISDYIYNLGIGLTSIPPNYGKVWYPCFDNFVERATYRYHVTTSAGKRLHGQGHLTGESIVSGDTILRSFAFEHPVTTHQSAIAVSTYIDSNYVHTGAYGDIPVRLTAKPANLGAMLNKFDELGGAIDALEYWWGPYAWERVGYVITTDGALEIPTNTAYPLSMMQASNYANRDLYAHELGHQWWGNLVAPRIHNHMWLKEGPAEYSGHLTTEWVEGSSAFIEAVKDNQEFVLDRAHVDDVGFHPMSPMPDEHIYGRTTYYKGASVWHNLRAFLGDELFRSGVQSVIATYFDGFQDAIMFQDALESATGVNLEAWFAAQIYQPGFSAWIIDSTVTADDATTLYLQQKLRACENFHDQDPLDITLYDNAWNRFETSVSASGEFFEFVVEHPSFTPVMVALNTRGRLNQARLDFEYVIDGTSGFQNLPWVKMRVGCEEITDGDSALVRVEHHWTAPDAENLAPYFDEISDQHFWTVDGIWPSDLVLDARIQYIGADAEDLDYGLYGVSEANAFLAWRPDASTPWQESPDYEWLAGSMLNGTGVFKILKLHKGQYTLAKGDVSLAVEPLIYTAVPRAYPSPSRDKVTVEGASGTVTVADAAGRVVFESQADGLVYLDVGAWAAGLYTASWRDESASSGGQVVFVVE